MNHCDSFEELACPVRLLVACLTTPCIPSRLPNFRELGLFILSLLLFLTDYFFIQALHL